MSNLPWNKPNGICAQCGAPLNENMVGGYKLHDGTYAVRATQIHVAVPHRHRDYYCCSEEEM